MQQVKHPPSRPWWVKAGLWGLPTRGSALVFFCLSIVLAIASALCGLRDVRFLAATVLLVFTALWYWCAIQWVDRNAGWPASDQVKRAKVWTAWALAAALLGVALMVMAFLIIFSYHQIPQNGMYPTLPAGSRFFALRSPYRNPSDVGRGDIVVLARKVEGLTQHFVLRVIALPSDAVSVIGNVVIVNSKSLPRAEIRSEGDIVIYKELNDQAAYEVAYGKKTPSTLPPPITVKVPPGHFFVLGDNRHHAADSRHFGLVPFEAIVGRKW